MNEKISMFLPREKEKKAFISSIVIFVIGIIAEIVFLVILQDKQHQWKGWIIIVMGLISPIFGLFLWNKYIPRFAPKVLKFLINNFIGRKLIGGGSFAYFEYKPPEYQEGWFSPLGRFIAVIIAYLGITVTIAKIIFSFLPFSPKTPIDSILALFFWVVMMIIVPIIMTPITPVVWGLEDADVKIWNKGDKTNWRVSKRYKARFNSIVSISAIIAGLSIGNQSLMDKIILFIQIIAIAFIIIIVPNALIVMSYYSYFKKILTSLVKESVKLKTYETTLREIKESFTTLDKSEEEITTSENIGSQIEQSSVLDNKLSSTENINHESTEATDMEAENNSNEN